MDPFAQLLMSRFRMTPEQAERLAVALRERGRIDPKDDEDAWTPGRYGGPYVGDHGIPRSDERVDGRVPDALRLKPKDRSYAPYVRSNYFSYVRDPRHPRDMDRFIGGPRTEVIEDRAGPLEPVLRTSAAIQRQLGLPPETAGSLAQLLHGGPAAARNTGPLTQDELAAHTAMTSKAWAGRFPDDRGRAFAEYLAHKRGWIGPKER